MSETYSDEGADGGEVGHERQGTEAERPDVPAREPLAYEEVEKRWTSTKTALNEERSKRRAYEKEIADLRAKAEKTNEPDPFEAIATGLRDDLDDPLADIESMKKALRLVAQQNATARQQETQTAAQQREAQALARTVHEHETEFHEANPDYYDAVKHLTSARAEELGEAGLSGQALSQKINDELRDVVKLAMDQGRNPAAVIYAMSKRRGFGIDNADKTLQTIQSGQRAGLSLSNAGGKNGSGGTLTWNHVSGLKGKAFSDAFSKLKAQETRRA